MGERASCPFVVFFNALGRDALGTFFQTGVPLNTTRLNISPKGIPIPAQGNALGCQSKKSQPQRGCLVVCLLNSFFCYPLGNPVGVVFLLSAFPRALPWAGIGNPVGVIVCLGERQMPSYLLLGRYSRIAGEAGG
jgi:hypothetical protein